MFLDWLETASKPHIISSKAKHSLRVSVSFISKVSLHMLRVNEKVLPFFVENGLFFTACRPSLNVNHVTKSRDLLTE